MAEIDTHWLIFCQDGCSSRVSEAAKNQIVAALEARKSYIELQDLTGGIIGIVLKTVTTWEESSPAIRAKASAIAKEIRAESGFEE